MTLNDLSTMTSTASRPKPGRKPGSRASTRKPFDDIGVFPSIVIDPEINNISHVILHSSLGTSKHLTLREAVKLKLIALTAYGDKVVVFIKNRAAQVVLIPSTHLLKHLSPQPGERTH